MSPRKEHSVGLAACYGERPEYRWSPRKEHSVSLAASISLDIPVSKQRMSPRKEHSVSLAALRRPLTRIVASRSPRKEDSVSLAATPRTKQGNDQLSRLLVRSILLVLQRGRSAMGI